MVPLLVAEGYDVTLLLREAYGMGTPLPHRLAVLRDQLHTVYADLRNLAQTSRAIAAAAPEGVVHLAAMGATDPFLNENLALRHNLYGTIHLLRACFESGSGVSGWCSAGRRARTQP